jgi:arylsulfatase A-like enzyme
MKTLKCLIILGAVGLFFSCSEKKAVEKESKKKPNVVVMLIDNQGYYELSRNGNQIVQTPRIDKLSTQAVNFTEFYAPPFCSPSRSALLTGRYALRSGIHNTVGGVSILHKNETTMAKLLKENGYNTAIFGKWHLGSSYPYAPKFRGFDEVFVHGGGGVSQLGDYYGNNHIDATYSHNDEFVPSKGFSTDVLFDQAINYIENKKEDEEPFYCFVSTPAVHFPTNRHPVTTQRLLDRGVEDSKYMPLYSMIENVDDNVGKMLDYLKKSGLKENTIVVLASDQGVNDRGAEQHRSGTFQNRTLSFDEKHHVYCMIQYPELTDNNAGDTDKLTGMVDVMPTILDICDITLPSNLDGQSMKPLLNANESWDDERKLIIQCPRSRTRAKWKNTAVKYKKWRLVEGKELYNITYDFGQLKDVANDYPEIVNELKQSYEIFWNSLAPADELISEHILGAKESPEVRLEGMDWYEGDAPWTQQGLVNRKSQGKWRVHIENDGKYQFELRRYPREKIMPIEAVSASIKIGESEAKVEIDKAASDAILVLELKKGTYDMITTFKDPEHTESKDGWGANYVHVSYLE